MDRTTCGQTWAQVLPGGTVPLDRVAGTLEPLTDDLRQAGLVWSVLQLTLPALAAEPAPGLADLIAVAAAAAVRCDSAGLLRRDPNLPGEIVATLDELTRTPLVPLAMQARRLRNALTG